jgi:nucleotide-binding universal stress UspA family protein
MEPFKRIFVATDFSPCARLALDCAAMLARNLRGRVDVLYVSEVPGVLFGESVALGECFVDADVKEGRIQLERLLAELREQGIQADGEVRTGFAPDTIIEIGRPEQYDVLVLGTHGRTGLRRLWMGSVAERVVRASQIPVLTVRPPHLA